MSKTRLREDRWRVRRYVVPVPKKEVAARPWQLQALAPAPPTTTSVAVWGIWPPQWDIESQPLLVFPGGTMGWHMAFRAAFDRAQFSNSPEPPSPGVQSACYPVPPPYPESEFDVSQ